MTFFVSSRVMCKRVFCTVLCSAMLCCVLWCYEMFCYVVYCFVMLDCMVLCCMVLCCVVWHDMASCRAVLYFIFLCILLRNAAQYNMVFLSRWWTVTTDGRGSNPRQQIGRQRDLANDGQKNGIGLNCESTGEGLISAHLLGNVCATDSLSVVRDRSSNQVQQ